MPNNRLLPFELHNVDGILTDASQIKFGESSDVQDSLDNALLRIGTIERTAFNSGRSFVKFNDGFTIDRNNLSTYADKNIIYTAKNDKPLDNATRPDINLPSDEEILASGEDYPIAFEFTHLGGTGVFDDRNIVRVFVDGVERVRLNKDQVAVVIKAEEGADYTFASSTFDPSDTILASGVFNLKVDTHVSSIASISTELSSTPIVVGDAYFVDVGGEWSGLTVTDGSVIVALVNSPSLVDSVDNDDWLLLENPRVNAISTAFLSNWEKDGIVFKANRNIQVDPSNVLEFHSEATGLPFTGTVASTSQGDSLTSVFTNVPIQLTDVVGGKLKLGITLNVASVSGFSPSWEKLTLDYPGGYTFEFPLNDAPNTGMYISEIDIPNSDYSIIYGRSATVTLTYSFNGVFFTGSYAITDVVNTTKGSLNEPVRILADVSSSIVEARLTSRINSIVGDVNSESESLEAISDRISPYRTKKVTSPDLFAKYLVKSDGDSFPDTLDAMLDLSADNPSFKPTSSSVFIAVRPSGFSVLRDTSDGSLLELVNIGESLTASNGSTYFVYEVTGLNVSKTYEVLTTSHLRVVAWQDDIDTINDEIQGIESKLDHPILALPEELVNVLENEVTVSQEDKPVVAPNTFNTGLGSDSSQTIFAEDMPNSFSSGALLSKPIKDNTGDPKYRNKLAYIPAGSTFTTGQAYLSGFNGLNGLPIVEYSNGGFNAKVFVASVPSGTASFTLYPGVANRISGNGIWTEISAINYVNGFPQLLANEVFFTRDVPSTSVPVNVQYRGHSNGYIIDTGSIVLGANQNVATFTISSGGEQADVEVLRTNGQIRVSVTEHLLTGIPLITDVDVILSYTENRVVPSTPETTRDVLVEGIQEDGYQVFGIKASSAGTVIVVGNDLEVDTLYPYSTLFGSDESGTLGLVTPNSVFFDYSNMHLTPEVVRLLMGRSTFPNYGLFNVSYTHETVVNLDTQLTVLDGEGTVVNVGATLSDLLARVTALE